MLDIVPASVRSGLLIRSLFKFYVPSAFLLFIAYIFILDLFIGHPFRSSCPISFYFILNFYCAGGAVGRRR